MAATSGIMANPLRNVAADLIAHLTPLATPVPCAVTITGPLKLAAYTSPLTNTTTGTTGECADANYARQPITAWNAPTTTSGAGYQVGFVQQTSNLAITFGGSSGFAASQTITSYMLLSSDPTPVEVYYQNLAAPLLVPVNNKIVIASGSITPSIS